MGELPVTGQSTPQGARPPATWGVTQGVTHEVGERVPEGVSTATSSGICGPYHPHAPIIPDLSYPTAHRRLESLARRQALAARAGRSTDSPVSRTRHSDTQACP